MDALPNFKDHWHRGWFGPFPFTLEGVKLHAPRRSGVYQIRNAAGVIVYVGISTKSQVRNRKPEQWETPGASNVYQRLRAHVQGRGNEVVAQLRTLGALGGYTFAYHLCDGESAAQIESYLTVHHKPPYNDKTEYKYCLEVITVQ
jgi:hypothetical protein